MGDRDSIYLDCFISLKASTAMPTTQCNGYCNIFAFLKPLILRALSARKIKGFRKMAIMLD